MNILVNVLFLFVFIGIGGHWFANQEQGWHEPAAYTLGAVLTLLNLIPVIFKKMTTRTPTPGNDSIIIRKINGVHSYEVGDIAPKLKKMESIRLSKVTPSTTSAKRIKKILEADSEKYLETLLALETPKPLPFGLVAKSAGISIQSALLVLKTLGDKSLVEVEPVGTGYSVCLSDSGRQYLLDTGRMS